MRILLFTGSNSYEHEISLLSAFEVKKFLTKKNDIVDIIFIDKNFDLFLLHQSVFNKIDFKLEDIKKKARRIRFIKHGYQVGLKKVKANLAFSVLHGKNGEEGMLAALLTFYGILYAQANMISSAVTMDKAITKDILCKLGYPVVDYQVFFENEISDTTKAPFMPCIIKPSALGSSIGINAVRNQSEFFKKALDSFKYDKKIIVEPLLEDFTEANIALYGDYEQVYTSSVEIIRKNKGVYSFEEKYLEEKKKSTFLNDPLLTNQIVEDTSFLFRYLDLSGIVRFDLFIVKDKYYINEVNTIPGSLSKHLFEDFPLVLDRVKKMALRNHLKEVKKNNVTLNYSYSLIHHKK